MADLDDKDETVSLFGEVIIRPAGERDGDTIFAWRNLPELVRFSSSLRGVSRDEHDRWYRTVLDGQSRRLFMVERSGAAIGQVRFDRLGGPGHQRDCEVSLHLMGDWRGRGWGPVILARCCDWIGRLWDVERVLAHVRDDNAPSLSAFAKAGFVRLPGDDPFQRPGLTGFARPVRP